IESLEADCGRSGAVENRAGTEWLRDGRATHPVGDPAVRRWPKRHVRRPIDRRLQADHRGRQADARGRRAALEHPLGDPATEVQEACNAARSLTRVAAYLRG